MQQMGDTVYHSFWIIKKMTNNPHLEVLKVEEYKTTLKKIQLLLKDATEKNEKKIRVDKDNKEIFIEFSEYNWKCLDREIKMRSNPNLSLDNLEIVLYYLDPISEKSGVTYYCSDFQIDGIYRLDQVKRGLKKISKEVESAEYYINEAYKDFDKPIASNKELSQEEKEEISNEVRITPGFRELGILILARIYDNDKDAMSLPNIISYINKDFDNWKKNIENQLTTNILDKKLVTEDLSKLCKDSNESLHKLFEQRDKSIAHLDKDYVFELVRYNSSNRKLLCFPNESEIHELIALAKELLDRYSTIINFSI